MTFPVRRISRKPDTTSHDYWLGVYSCMLRRALKPHLHRRLLFLLCALVTSSLVMAGDGAAGTRPLMMLISIDGLKPEAVLDAADHGLKVPNLRAFLTDGAYATRVRGVLPTLTYPSHMTLMSGVSPAKHGIYANTTFDPFNRNDRGWYWYAEDGRVATLWDRSAAQHGQRVLAHQRRGAHYL
jgi:predicted AlkP superfamily pyrophosphatase or phosphodiesterase